MPGKPLLTVGAVPVYREDRAILYAAPMAIDFDGAPNAYHPPTAAKPNSGRPPGLDDLRNAGGPGNWYGVVTGSGRKDGTPVVQGPSSPCPGFYISPTALSAPHRRSDDVRAYVDAMSVPYVAIPGGSFRAATGAQLGDLAVVLYRNEPPCAAIIADIGPRARIGEGSSALARALHLDERHGHSARDVVYVLLSGTRTSPAWPRGLDEIHAEARQAFALWGGDTVEDAVARVQHVLPGMIG